MLAKIAVRINNPMIKYLGGTYCTIAPAATALLKVYPCPAMVIIIPRSPQRKSKFIFLLL